MTGRPIDLPKCSILQEAINSLHELKPPPSQAGVTVIAVIKNEIFYLRAFLDYYRKLGASRFVFLDDQSTDGGLDFLLQQPDCGVLTSDLTYGQFIQGEKVDVLWRNALALTYSKNRWALVVDADEFLKLPIGFHTLDELVTSLDKLACTAVGAIMVDFYPESVDELKNATPPRDAAEMFARHPYFDDLPHGQWVKDRNEFRRYYGGVRDRLMKAYGIDCSKRRRPLQTIKEQLRRAIGYKKPKGFNAIHKVPLMSWCDGTEYKSTHIANRPPFPGIHLPLVHFKFTGSFGRKISTAISSGAYHNNSAAYFEYAKLLDEMQKQQGSFIGSCSRAYRNRSDFLRSDLLRFPAGSSNSRRHPQESQHRSSLDFSA